MGDVNAALRVVMTEDRGRLLAALIGQLGDFQLAEDCLSEAMESALIHWRRGGLPRNPPGWLLQVARRKAIDRLRKAQNFQQKSAEIARLIEMDQRDAEEEAEAVIPDERLRLIFTCCHPALDQKTRVALTLRTLGGLTTEEIARAYLDKIPAMAQRLSRARQKIARAGIPFAIPQESELPERVQGVAQVIYLIFNEGYAATEGAGQIRVDLCEEAIFLARLMRRLCPEDPEVSGLLALILLTHARRAARVGANEDYVPLAHQDRSLWDGALIREGAALVQAALVHGRAGPYQIQASIAALHGEAKCHDTTDWAQIAALYRLLCRMGGGDVARLNECVAMAYAGDLQTALAQSAELGTTLAGYQPYHAARAELQMLSGDYVAAQMAYEMALSMTRIASEKRFLQLRLEQAKKKGRA